MLTQLLYWNKDVKSCPWCEQTPYNWWSAQQSWRLSMSQETASWNQSVPNLSSVRRTVCSHELTSLYNFSSRTLVPKNQDCLWLCQCIILKKKEGACASQTMEDCECQLHPLDFHCPFVGVLHWQKGKKKGSSNANVIEQSNKEG